MQTLKVVGIPNKLQLAFSLEGTNVTQVPLLFQIEGRSEPERIKMNWLGRGEDGSGNNFIVKGVNTANKCPVEVCFSYQTHSGTMKFL